MLGDWRRKREKTSRSSLPLLCHDTTFCGLSGCELKRPLFEVSYIRKRNSITLLGEDEEEDEDGGVNSGRRVH